MAGLNGTISIIYNVFIVCCLLRLGECTCGGYLKVAVGDTGEISSPNYPSNYGNNVNCIWLLRAPSKYLISLTTVAVTGEAFNVSYCHDYLEIRNGSSTGPLLLHGCDATVAGITVSEEYLWVKFLSNYQTTNPGFQATWLVTENSGSALTESPYVECAMEIRCPNKECVPWAYRCDDYNDCGCEADGCDETECDGLGLTVKDKLAIGIGSGAAFFVLAFFGIGFLDICLKKRSARKYEKHMEKQKQLQRKKKIQAMAALFVAQPSLSADSRSNSVADAGARKASVAPSGGIKRKPSMALSVNTNASSKV